MGRRALLVCVVSLFGAVAPAIAGPTVYDAAGTAQNSTVQYFPPRAGAGVAVDFDSFTSGVRGARLPVANTIRFAYGTRWNGRLFPQCRLATLRAWGPLGCPAGSLFARGYVDAPPLRHLAVDAFIGTVGGQDAQLSWVSANVVVVGLLSHIGGAVAERIDLRGLPLLEQFHVTDLRRSTRGTPLTAAPSRCPKGGWQFAFISSFASGPELVSTNRQPCVGR